ncbi:MAG: tRNA (N6-threonylcarbamoyladenosine(37)-N6)-methyltransferase TrmO [Verrucomicrobiota bacterium]
MNLIEIGRIHTPFKHATGTPIQPCRAVGTEGFIKINRLYVPGLKDLEGFDRIWLVFWCHRAADAKMLVVPYRDIVERGLFATRAPARPNPLGLSCVRLIGIEDDILRIAEVDVLDDTPLLDIKPYVPQYDNYPVQQCGWVDTVPQREVIADARFERQAPESDCP